MPVHAHVADLEWRSNGPYGANVQVMAMAPSHSRTLFESSGPASASQTYRTNDGADTWSPAYGSLPSFITNLGVDAADPDIAYALSPPHPYRTMDGGATWEPIQPSVRSFAVSLSVDPIRPGKLYLSNGRYGVLRSNDYGTTWRRARVGLPPDVNKVVPDPVNEGTIYAVAVGGISKSTDSGRTWLASSSGLTDMHVYDLAIAASDPSVLYATTAEGISRSTDAGASWQFIGSSPASVTAAVHVDPQDASRLYLVGRWSGLWRSTNSGSTWKQMTGPLLDRGVTDLAIDPSHRGRLYAATPYGVILTADGGATWSLANEGIRSALPSVTADPADPELVYASTGAGFYRSTDAGTSWELLPGPATNGGVVVDPADPSVVYSGVWKSIDGGVDWTRMYIPRPDHLDSFVIDSADPSVLFAAGYGFRSGGLYESTDAGASWTQLFRDSVSNVAMAATSPPTLYIALARRQGNLLSKSRDLGATWHQLESAPSGVGAIVPNPDYPSTVNVGAGSKGVFKTTDSGHSWSPTGTGLESEIVDSLAVDPVHPAVVFAGTSGGVFESPDGGGAWRNVSGQLEVMQSGIGMSVNSGGSVVYAATPTGVWQAQTQT